MDKNINLFCCFASLKASSLKPYQLTGLCACCNKYGELCVLWIKKEGHFFEVSELPNDGVKNIILSEAMLTYFKHAIAVISIYRSGIPLPISLVGVGWS
jgi:hypothetical protein